MRTSISSNLEFIELKALKNVNASLDDIERYLHGELDPTLLNVLVSFYIGEGLYSTHTNDAVKIEEENRRIIAAAKNKSKGKK